MGRSKRNKIFDLFKTGFKITFFYKPTMEFGDEYYYVILDDVIELRLKIINNVVVIDTVMTLSQSYIKPLFDKLVTLIMEQNNLSVIVSIMGDTGLIHQACINHSAPIIEDEQFVTVSKGYYNKWKAHVNDVSKYGFYLLAVSEDETSTMGESSREPTPPNTKSKKTEGDKPNISPKLDNRFNKIKLLLTREFPSMKFEIITYSSIHCLFDSENSFSMEIIDNVLYIKDLLQTHSQTLNFVKIMLLVNCFEEIIPIIPDLFIINIMSVELCRICDAKKYVRIDEAQHLPLNNLFKQAFQGFGTYKITINN